MRLPRDIPIATSKLIRFPKISQSRRNPILAEFSGTRSRRESMRNFRYRRSAPIHLTDQSYSTEAPAVCMHACRKLSRRETSALHLCSFHVGECECRHDRHCLLLKRSPTIIAIIENRAFTVTDL